MTSTNPATGVDVQGGSLWSRAPYPVLIADLQGAIILVNEAASALLPQARPGTPMTDAVPDWLSSAHAALRIPRQGAAAEPAVWSGRVGDRVFEAHPTVEDSGTVLWWLVDTTDHRLAEEALRRERERTAFLGRASNLLLSSLNLERCTNVTAQMAAEHLADAALVVAPMRGNRLPIVTCLGDGNPVASSAIADPASVPGLVEALQGFPPVPTRWVDPRTVPDWVVPEGFGAPGSIVVTPLPGHGVPAGALILLRRADGPGFTPEEEVFARLFAARAGAAMSAARLYADQSAITDVLMRELLPPSLRQVSGVDFAGGYRPSEDHERIGGDFYDVHPAATEGAPSLVVLGDVCGKGLEAAVLTGKIRNTLHALLPLADDHQRMLALLNMALLNSHHTRFATLVLASAVREGGSVRMRVTSAGHPPPLVVRATGEVEEADTRGTLIGAIPEVRADSADLFLAPGETCVLYTDGFTEARGGPMGDAMFGEERLRRVLAECAGMPAEGIVERIQMVAAQWVGTGRHDDMAVVVVSAPRSHHLSAVNGHTRGRFTA
ncbi:PP2C family protein-serine/threonine phosphatase [Streptomyces xanthochromogenes]|uniref:PP2C family protein-serine/threonine phosphatase n=1 Tax=Streptomyces xanthochromogenes TaxID=67384 RepID=UPI00380A4282